MDHDFLAQMLVDTLVANNVDEALATKIITTARGLSDPDTVMRCRLELLQHGNKIGLIKTVRALTGFSLKEAKQCVEDPLTIYEVSQHKYKELVTHAKQYKFSIIACS